MQKKAAQRGAAFEVCLLKIDGLYLSRGLPVRTGRFPRWLGTIDGNP